MAYIIMAYIVMAVSAAGVQLLAQGVAGAVGAGDELPTEMVAKMLEMVARLARLANASVVAQQDPDIGSDVARPLLRALSGAIAAGAETVRPTRCLHSSVL